MTQISVRQSNFELLRNISMFMILMLHANFVALGFPSKDELLLSPSNVITRYSIEALSISSVNAFVFISGWFGIHPSVKSVFKFIYQILFFLGFLYLFFLIIGKTKLSFSSIIDIFQLSSKDWFVKSYFVLMILAPVLNLFTRYLDHGTQIIVLLSFFLFEIIYGWMGGGARFFMSGFGPLHMIGIYILAQYIKKTLSQEKTTYSSWLDKLIALNACFDLLLFFFFTICTTTFGCFTLHIFGEPLTNYTLAYNSPFVIAGGVFLSLFFSKLRIPYIKIINWLGASSFAVYLFHSDGTIRNIYFIPIINKIYKANTGIVCVFYIFLFLLIIYLLSCLIDQIRKKSWEYLSHHFFNLD